MISILVVEDDNVLSKAYELILKNDGHKVFLATNGKKALSIAESEKPQVILLDLLMPVMDGIKFLKTLQRSDQFDPTVIVLSNLGDEKKVKEAMQLGAYKYIVKSHATPIQLSMLVKRAAKDNPAAKS